MRGEEGFRAIILYFLFIVVKLSSETSRSASNIINNGRAMLYRSEFDDYTAKISHYYYFRAGGHDPTIPVFSAESGAI